VQEGKAPEQRAEREPEDDACDARHARTQRAASIVTATMTMAGA
jgi:hypothetical protein